MTYDRVAVITGADSGIGKTTAAALAANGFDVGVTHRPDRAGDRGRGAARGRPSPAAGRVPVPRPRHAAEVAEAITFLAGPGASCVPEPPLFVDGGLGLMGLQAAGALKSANRRKG